MAIKIREMMEGGLLLGQRTFIGVVLQLLLITSECRTLLGVTRNDGVPLKQQPVQLRTLDGHVVVSNGIIDVTFANPTGTITSLKYNGVEILEQTNKESDRGYWDINWSDPKKKTDILDKLEGHHFKVIKNEEGIVEISFSRQWNSTQTGHAPLNVDKRYIVLQGSSGFYSYGIFERLKGWPDADIFQGRIVFKLAEKLFNYMAVSDTMQRIMPTYKDRENGEPLAYPEAVRLTNPSNPDLKGEVDDKYQYSVENKDNKVHGWISSQPSAGFWMITPSNEFRTGGPCKQDLTSHAGPYTINMFFSTHYAGESLGISFRKGEPWKKVFGPVFVYLNSGNTKNDTAALWNNAKETMLAETAKWPYDFPASVDFLRANQRGSVEGRLEVRDGKPATAASASYVGLALPGDPGSWQMENKGYQFWTQADADGRFVINNVLPGSYNLYAWVPGYIGDFRHPNVTVKPGGKINLGVLTFVPPRNGPTLWEIGIPDRTAAEFYVPEPHPTHVNRLYANKKSEMFRQYGLWDRYADLYPSQDLVFNIGTSNYKTDWFFAHVNRHTGNEAYAPTTWAIFFNLTNVVKKGQYRLQIALAAANAAEIQVRVNDPNAPSIFTTRMIGKDNAIARHGIHGLYSLYSANVLPSQLYAGKNTIFLSQTRSLGPFFGVMYDYLRLEAPKP